MNLERLRFFYDFQGLVVLVTGGTGVLGLEIAHTLVDCNATVVVLSRDEERTGQDIAHVTKDTQSKGSIVWVQGDVLASDSLQTTR